MLTPECRVQIETWIEALRSGRYKQGRHAYCRYLGEDDWEFCALGVYYDVTVEGDWFTNKLAENPTYTVPPHLQRDVDVCLRELPSLCSSVPGWFLADVIRVNDVNRLSFEVIADLVEASLAEATSMTSSATPSRSG